MAMIALMPDAGRLAWPDLPMTTISAHTAPRWARQTSPTVGSPTTAMSARKSRSVFTRWPMPSRPPELSSAVGMRIRSPRRGIRLSATARAADTMAATPDFMSLTPRP